MSTRKPKAQKDLFGLVLNNFLHGDKTHYSTVRNDNWTEYPNDPAEYFHVDTWFVKRAKGKVLDVGCGSGSYMLELKKKKHDVYGIDIDANCIKTCKKRGLKNVWAENILKPSKTKKLQFDTIILAGNNLGIAGNPKNLEKMLKHFHSITSKNGIVLGEGLNFATTTNPLHKKYHQMQRSKGKFPGTVTIRIEYKDTIGEWFDWMHTPLKELTIIAKKAGWKVSITKKKGKANYWFELRKM